MILGIFNNDNKNKAKVKLNVEFYRSPVTSMVSCWLFITFGILFTAFSGFNIHLFLKLKRAKKDYNINGNEDSGNDERKEFLKREET